METLRDWLFASPHERHRPPHAPDRGLALFVTASTVDRFPHLQTPGRRDAFRDLLFQTCEQFQIEMLAWVILREHYHVVIVPESREGFSAWVTALHRRSAIQYNQEDGVRGRQCWYDYWDRSLWTDGDVLCRINYIHGNPVKHGHAEKPEEWPWSSVHQYLALDEQEAVRERLSRFPAPGRFPGDDF
jgi:putative transposase